MSPLVHITRGLALGIPCQWLAWRLKFPSILLLLAVGFVFAHLTGAPTPAS